MNNNESYANGACPYLGLLDDADTSLAFPSVWSGCHRSHPTASPNLKHQAEYCLGENHCQCPVFLNQQEDAPLPVHLRASHSHAREPRRSSIRTFVFILVGIAALAGLAWGFLSLGLSTATPTSALPSPMVRAASTTPVATHTESASSTSASVAAPYTRTLTFTVTASLIATDSVTPTPTFTKTATASSTATRTDAKIFTATPTATLVQIATSTAILSKRRLDAPIGNDYKFVIHRATYGENINQYADKYNTSVKTIVAVNFNLKSPLWVDALVIIPVGFTNVASLPVFEAYQVTQTGSADALAQELGVSAADLKYYNAISAGESLVAGDWLLVPHPKPAP